MYGDKSYTVKPLPKVDTVIQAEVIGIVEGTFEEFVEPQYLDNFKNPESACIELEIKTVDGYKIKRLIALPEDEEVSPKSDFGKYISKYDSAPKIGDTVNCIYTKKGDNTFYKLML